MQHRSMNGGSSILAQILNEGDYTPQQLIAALKFEIEQKVLESMRRGNNRLTYMQNSLTYLNQRTFEAFIELIEQEGDNAGPAEPTGSTDI